MPSGRYAFAGRTFSIGSWTNSSRRSPARATALRNCWRSQARPRSRVAWITALLHVSTVSRTTWTGTTVTALALYRLSLAPMASLAPTPSQATATVISRPWSCRGTSTFVHRSGRDQYPVAFDGRATSIPRPSHLPRQPARAAMQVTRGIARICVFIEHPCGPIRCGRKPSTLNLVTNGGKFGHIPSER